MAVHFLQPHRALFDEFMRESRSMESIGPIVDPTLFMSSERRATEAMLKPLYQGAIDFLTTHDQQIARVRAALEKVNG